MVIGEHVLTGRLWDNAMARDLIAQLPLTLTFRDFKDLEKIGQFDGSMDAITSQTGDFTARIRTG